MKRNLLIPAAAASAASAASAALLFLAAAPLQAQNPDRITLADYLESLQR